MVLCSCLRSSSSFTHRGLPARSILQSKLSLFCCLCFCCSLRQVTVDNESYDDRTIITVDSANRPGTLVEVVQCLTELGLNVKRARISSDGGWFVDEFHVTETAGPIQQVSSNTAVGQMQDSAAVTAQQLLTSSSKVILQGEQAGEQQMLCRPM